MNTFAVSSSDFQKKYKTVFERVRQTKQPALLTSKKEPQAVLISLEDYAKLQDLRRKNSARAALAFAKEMRELLKDETAGSVKTTIAALSARQLRAQAEQSIADVAIARAAHRRKARSSAQALAGLISHGTDLPTDLSARHNAYTGDLPLACRSGRGVPRQRQGEGQP
jgi:prevent-host-death family protein